MIFLLAIALFLCAFPTIHAQGQFTMDPLTPEQGLSQSIVYKVFQDREGFLWFGTRDGINRYDGYRFTISRHEPFNPSSIPWTSASAFGEDPDGNIWIGSTHGAGKLDRRTFCFTPFTHVDSLPHSLSNNAVTCIESDRAGNIWIGTDHGLNRFDPATGGFIRFHSVPSDPTTLGSDQIFSLYRDRVGDLWVGTTEGYIHRLNPDGRSFTRFDAGLGNPSGIICLGDDGHGLLYVTFSSDLRHNGLTALDRATGRIVRRISHPVELDYPYDCYVLPRCIDSLGGLWIEIRPWTYSSHGRIPVELRRIELDGGRARTTLRIGQVESMICDRSGIVWVGTQNGVVKLNPGRHRFTTYRNVDGDPWSLSNDHIRSVHRDRLGTLWVGTDEGLNRLDERTGHWIHYLHDPLNPASISDNSVNTIFEDTDGGLLFGTNDCLNVFNRATGAFSKAYNIGEGGRSLGQMFVWSIYRDSLGQLWVGTNWTGIHLFDRNGKFVRTFRLAEGEQQYGKRQVVWDLHCDRFGTLWAGASSGLYRWLPDEKRFMRYPSGPNAAQGLSDDNVCAIMEDSSGALWFTTYGGGLNRYDRARDRFTAITTRNGLPSNAIYGTLMDNAGRLWISSNTGLTTYDPATGGSHVYTVGDGLQGNEFGFRAFYKGVAGEFFFGGTHGLNRFFPDSLRQSTWEAPVVITEFRIFDTIARHELTDRDTVTLTHDQSFISFEFAALDYGNPAGIRYTYRLEGFEKEWVHCDQRRYASFTNLDPGTYIFVVTGTNSDGVWGRRPLRIVLRVVPPYWMTWWFKSLTAIALLTAGAAGAWLRIRAARGRETLRRRSVESQLQALRLQINPHFIFNALSSIQHLILVREQDLAVEYLSRFSRLMRAVLENSERTSIPIAEEIENLRHYLHLESLRFEGQFRYTIQVDSALDIRHLEIPTMLIQPYVENAIRHGLLHKQGEGSLDIALFSRGNHIHCVIEDDGIGRARAGEIQRRNGGQPRSMGIRVTEERLGILNAASSNGESISMEITDLPGDDGAPGGTRVDIFIPIEFA